MNTSLYPNDQKRAGRPSHRDRNSSECIERAEKCAAEGLGLTIAADDSRIDEAARVVGPPLG